MTDEIGGDAYDNTNRHDHSTADACTPSCSWTRLANFLGAWDERGLGR